MNQDGMPQPWHRMYQRELSFLITPQCLRNGAGHTGFGDDAGYSIVLVENDHIGGAGFQQIVKGFLCVISDSDRSCSLADDGIDGL